ncbi:MAG: adenylate/guanylate cyclase domain-containing protein [Bacteroidota bacterium]
MSDFSILYVDDEPQNLLAFKATFRRDYKVYTAKSAQEGIDLMKKNMIHMVVTDQRMPGMTGVQFLQEIIPNHPETIRMVLTGFSDVEAIINAINDGQVYRYITKPWNESELRMTLQTAEKLYRLQANNHKLLEDLQHRVNEMDRTLELFSRYVPEAIVTNQAYGEAFLQTEGELRYLTVLFCDIIGFTPLSEEMTPREVVTFLNDYYSCMTRVVHEHGGTINEFVGDEVFAVFEEKEGQPSHQERAVACAEAMRQELPALNLRYQEKFTQEIQLSLGINSGKVIAGNLGSKDRLKFSFTGDTVNTAKRIETLAKAYPNSIYVSDTTFQNMPSQFKAVPMDPVNVKGKEEPIKLYKIEPEGVVSG